jgi:hypothetical protein
MRLTLPKLSSNEMDFAAEILAFGEEARRLESRSKPEVQRSALNLGAKNEEPISPKPIRRLMSLAMELDAKASEFAQLAAKPARIKNRFGVTTSKRKL